MKHSPDWMRGAGAMPSIKYKWWLRELISVAIVASYFELHVLTYLITTAKALL
jgi:hypothetical protein